MSTVEIPLTRGQVALIDEEDLPLIAPYKWHTRVGSSGMYAARTEWIPGGTRRVIWMHRIIAGAAEGEEVDHRDSGAPNNTLNNTRANLRPCDKAHNQANRGAPRSNKSGYKGVFFNPKRVAHPWQTYIGTKTERESLGSYDTAEEAAEAYNRAARAKYGEFARLNVIDQDNPVPRPDVALIRKDRPSEAPRKGVTFDAETGKWRARIYIDGRRTNLGRFDTLDEAGRAYDEAEQRRSEYYIASH